MILPAEAKIKQHLKGIQSAVAHITSRPCQKVSETLGKLLVFAISVLDYFM